MNESREESWMMGNELALHEALEIHELLAFKNVCMTKATTIRVLVADEELKGLLSTAAAADRKHVEDLKGLLARGTTTSIIS